MLLGPGRIKFYNFGPCRPLHRQRFLTSMMLRLFNDAVLSTLEVSETDVLRKIFGTKKDRVNG
jgi:hypothetical protein